MALSFSDLYWLARRVGLGHDQARIAAAVALAESSGRPTAVGDRGTSYGLWQIHLPAHPWARGMDLTDPYQNAVAMARISGGGTNWKPWTTYRTGAYRKFLDAPIGPESQMFGGGQVVFTQAPQGAPRINLPRGGTQSASPVSLDILARAKHMGLL